MSNRLLVKRYEIELQQLQPGFEDHADLNLTLGGTREEIQNFINSLYRIDGYPYIELPEYIKDKEDEGWISHTLKINDKEITVATNGKTVRIMSLEHLFVEVPLVIDRNYGPDTVYLKKKSTEPFIKEDEMEL